MGWVEIKGRKRRIYRWEIENAIIPPIYRLTAVSAPPLSIYLFWKSMCMYRQLWLWFTSSLGFTSKNSLNALYGLGTGFPSSFLKNWQTWSFLVRFPKLCRACSLLNCGNKSWIARCTSPLGCVSRVNRRLSKDPLLRPSLMNCILSSWFIDTIRKEWHVALQVHMAHLWQTFSCFARLFFVKVLSLIPSMCEMKELETHLIIGPLLQLASEYLQEFHYSLATSILHI